MEWRRAKWGDGVGKDCQAGCPTLGHVCGHLCLIEIGVSSVFLSASGPSWIASHVKSQDTFSVRTAYQIAESQLLIIHYTLYNIAVEHYYSRGGEEDVAIFNMSSSPTCFSTSIGYPYPLVFGFDVEVPILALACCSIVFTSNMSESDYYSITGTNIRTANVIKEYGEEC